MTPRRSLLVTLPFVGVLAGCDHEIGPLSRPFLEIEGAIRADEPLMDVRGAWVWVWIRNGQIAARAEPAEIEPELGGYRARLFTPPEVTVGPLEPPPELSNLGDSTVLLGSLVLLEDDIEPTTVRVEAVPLLHAITEGRVPVDSVWSTADQDAESPVMAGWTTERLALFSSGTVDATHVDGHSGWTGAPCELAKIGLGLALYDEPSEPDTCAWSQRAPPGSQSTLTGVTLRAPEP